MNIVGCKVCANTVNNKIFKVREMFLGLREDFFYQQCGNCCLMQLLNIPGDLSKYYPADKYYSLKIEGEKKIHAEPLRKIKADYLLHNKKKLIGKLLSIGYHIPEYYQWLKKVNVQFSDTILDVGCGNGGLLRSLNKMGFTNLTGIDPFNEKDLDYGNLKIYKKNIFELNGKYDLIMLNHVFEHMDEPEKILEKLYQLINKNKYVLIRTPVMNNYAWRTYGVDWMSLDAPRHLIIHTVQSIKILCEKAGFVIKDIVFDSTGDGLIGSEQYKKNIPLMDPRSYFTDREKSTVFTKQEINQLNNIAKEKNAQNDGDQAAFYLYKP